MNIPFSQNDTRYFAKQPFLSPFFQGPTGDPGFPGPPGSMGLPGFKGHKVSVGSYPSIRQQTARFCLALMKFTAGNSGDAS